MSKFDRRQIAWMHANKGVWPWQPPHGVGLVLPQVPEGRGRPMNRRQARRLLRRATRNGPPLLSDEQLADALREGYARLIVEGDMACCEMWDGVCPLDLIEPELEGPDLPNFHVCFSDPGHEGEHVCGCGATHA